jgi:hypothetical protein
MLSRKIKSITHLKILVLLWFGYSRIKCIEVFYRVRKAIAITLNTLKFIGTRKHWSGLNINEQNA